MHKNKVVSALVMMSACTLEKLSFKKLKIKNSVIGIIGKKKVNDITVI